MFWTMTAVVFLVGLYLAFEAGYRHAQARQREIDEIRRHHWRPPLAPPTVDEDDSPLTARRRGRP